jgi:peptidyl-prolyl cis-trans isomerase A (cyclophilin A)
MALGGRRQVLSLVAALALAAPALAAFAQTAPAPRVVMTTGLGDIEIEVYPDRAPITAGNFLAYVDKGLWKGASFYRVVRPDNDRTPAITVIQGGLARDDGPLPPIVHETTAKTGLRHTDGVLSMARGAPGTAASEFFISVGDNPSLDFGGARNPDGQGFATFGKVVRGMDVVRKIGALRDPVAKTEFMPGQELAHPVAITAVRRVR